MDPLSITAGTLSVVSHAFKILELLKAPGKDVGLSESSAAVRLETEIYTKVLQEVGEIALSGPSTLPESAMLSLQFCQQQLTRLETHIKRAFDSNNDTSPVMKRRLGLVVKESAAQELVKGMKDYRRSVKILRDIVMDAMTQELLVKNSQQQLTQSRTGDINIVIDWTRGEETTESQIEAFVQRLSASLSNGNINIGPVNIVNSFAGKAPDGDAQQLPAEIMKELRTAAEGIHEPRRAFESSPNPFEFYAKIMRSPESSEGETRVCVKLDTGSKDNWISGPTVDRAGLRGLIESTAEKLYTGADGSMFYSEGVISVHWTRNSTKSWETKYLVLERATFDMLLGQQFIIEEGLFVFADPVLVNDITRLAPLSKEAYHEMEQNMRKKGLENQELSETRAAIAAAKRQRRREEKASKATSFMSLATTPGSVTPATFSSIRPTLSSLSQASSARDQTEQRSNSQVSNEAGA